VWSLKKDELSVERRGELEVKMCFLTLWRFFSAKLAIRWLCDSFYPAARQAKLNILKNLFGLETFDDNLTVKGCSCMECSANKITPGRAWRPMWRWGCGPRPTIAGAWVGPARGRWCGKAGGFFT